MSLQVYTEMIRLTNENALREHTDEHGDLFLWFKHQASQGIVGAQVRLLVNVITQHPSGIKQMTSN